MVLIGASILSYLQKQRSNKVKRSFGAVSRVKFTRVNFLHRATTNVQNTLRCKFWIVDTCTYNSDETSTGQGFDIPNILTMKYKWEFQKKSSVSEEQVIVFRRWTSTDGANGKYAKTCINTHQLIKSLTILVFVYLCRGCGQVNFQIS